MNKTKQRILEAYSRGYRILEDGTVVGPKGVLSIACYGKQRYPTISTNWDRRVFGIPAHMLAAYCFYKEEYLTADFIVRHLDGNTLNLSRPNIALGTHSDNELDKNPSLRKQVARLARQAQSFTPPNAKLTPEQVLAIRAVYASHNGKKLPQGVARELTVKFGVSRTVLVKVKNREYYPNVG